MKDEDVIVRLRIRLFNVFKEFELVVVVVV